MDFILKHLELKMFPGTSVTAGAVVWSLVSALVAGVVTEMTLSPHRVTSLLTADGAMTIIKEPAGGCDHKQFVHNVHTHDAPMCMPSLSHRAGWQLVQSSSSGPVHCRQVASHKWHFPCLVMYSPADGQQQLRFLDHFLYECPTSILWVICVLFLFVHQR